MTLDQGLAFGIILCTIALFVWGRIAYDLVALMSLFAGVVTGVVPAKRAFEGFADDIVIIVAAALLVSAAIARSGVIETLMAPVLRRLRSTRTQVPVLVGSVALLSVFCKNVGALAIFLPVALQLSRRSGTSPSALLMPMAFASLLGGIVTLIGTSPNIIISQVRQDVLGRPFGMFSYTPVGAGIAVVGVLFLSLAYRLVPNRRPAAGMDAAFTLDEYMTEALVPPDSALAGRSVAEIEAVSDNSVGVRAVIRERFRRVVPTPDWVVRGGDTLLLQGEAEDLERLVGSSRLVLSGEGALHAAGRPRHDVSVVEGVVTAQSSLLGRTAEQAGLQGRFALTLLAVSRSGNRVAQRLGALRFRTGDVVVLKGDTGRLPDALGTLHVLPLAERRIALGASHRSWLPGLVLLVALLLVDLHVLPVAIAFLGAAIVLLLLRVLTMHEAYATVEWSVLILLGALIPVSQAVRRTGGTDLIAAKLTPLLAGLPPSLALCVVLVIAMVVTPFLHNAPTVLMLGPVAATLAIKLHLNPDAFLMAVALGAGCDFLTPIGHQCNTLVFAPGGYRFGDYWRLGLPLSFLVVVMGVPLIALVWGLR